MNRQEVEKRTEELFRGGLHCAEAVLQAVLEGEGAAVGEGRAEFSPRIATAFGGGGGRSSKGLCGALSGGLMALGYLRGRNTPDEPWDEIAATADGLRARFAAEYGCTRCFVVLENLGPQEKMAKCVRLAGNTAGMIHEALHAEQDQQDQTAAQPCGCGCADLHESPVTGTPATGAPTPSAPASCGCK